MMEWWHGLGFSLQFFYGIGILGTVVLAIQLVLGLFGADVDGVADAGGLGVGGLDGGLDSAAHASGLHILSIRTVIAFLAGFGWTGVLVLQAGRSTATAVLIATGVGFLLMLMVFWLMRGLYSLRQSGSLDYRNAVGATGTVYIKIPALGQGTGQIQILVQGRLATVPAATELNEPIPSGRQVRAVKLLAGNTLLVETL